MKSTSQQARFAIQNTHAPLTPPHKRPNPPTNLIIVHRGGLYHTNVIHPRIPQLRRRAHPGGAAAQDQHPVPLPVLWGGGACYGHHGCGGGCCGALCVGGGGWIVRQSVGQSTRSNTTRASIPYTTAILYTQIRTGDNNEDNIRRAAADRACCLTPLQLRLGVGTTNAVATTAVSRAVVSASRDGIVGLCGPLPRCSVCVCMCGDQWDCLGC